MLTREQVIEKEDAFTGLLDHTRVRLVEAVRSFVPLELQESGFDIEGLDLKKLAAGAARQREPSWGGQRESKSAGGKVASRQTSAAARTGITSRAKHPSLSTEEGGRDESAAHNSDSRPTSDSDDAHALRRSGSDLSRASKLRSAVGATSREAAPIESGTIPRRIGATHLEATKKKAVPGATNKRLQVYNYVTLYLRHGSMLILVLMLMLFCERVCLTDALQ
jgi:hypothetical protein